MSDTFMSKRFVTIDPFSKEDREKFNNLSGGYDQDDVLSEVLSQYDMLGDGHYTVNGIKFTAWANEGTDWEKL